MGSFLIMKNNTVQKNIPQGWEEKDLLNCFNLPSKLAGIKLSEYEKEGDFPVFDQCKDYISGYSSKKDLVIDNVPVILFGDHTRVVKYIKSPFVVGADGTKIFWAKEGFDPTFLYYLVLNQKIPNTGYNRHFKFFKDINILLPKSKKEQQKIAEILGVVDENIAKTQEVIGATEKLKKGLMQQLFTRGIGHTKFKKTKLGEIPEEWEVVTLKEVANVERGKFSHRPRNAPEFYGGQYSFIQTGDIVNSNGKISVYTQTLNEKGLSVSKMFKKNTIVMTIAANIGDTAILEFDSCFPDSLVGITPNNDMDTVFLEYNLCTRKKYLNSIATQSAQKNINLQKLEPMLIIKPQIKEQQKIAEILSAVDEKIAANKKLKTKLTQLKKGLMQDLLSGVVRINI